MSIETTIGVPDKETGSCLDPELSGTGLLTEGGEGPSPPYSGEKSQLKPSRDGETEKRRRKTHSGHDEGGSVANRLRRLLPLITDNLKEVTRSSGYVIVFFFLSGE
jgi:hypothetical protein